MHGWYKPKARFVVDGEQWTTNGYIALRDSRSDPDLREAQDRAYSFLIQQIAASDEPASFSFGERGFAYLDTGIGLRRPYQSHFVRVVEAEFGTCHWHTQRDERAPAIAFVDGKALAMLMPLTNDRGSYHPPCPACDGNKGDECDSCGGVGNIECDACGHESDCDDCNGEGYVPNCTKCHGSGRWEISMDHEVPA